MSATVLDLVFDDTVLEVPAEESTVLEVDQVLVLGGDSPGGGGDVPLVQLVAGTDLSGHRVVTTDDTGKAVYASNDQLADRTGPFFLTTGAAVAGASIEPLGLGAITEPGWSWTPGAFVFLGTNGLLTGSPPTSPALFSLRVGTALTATSLFFNPQTPIVFT